MKRLENWTLFCFRLLAFASFPAFSQTLDARLINTVDGKPVPYASIFYKTKNVGTYSDSIGHFEIPYLADDTLVVSAMGFMKAQFSAKDLLRIKELGLTPIVMTIDDVEINTKREMRDRKNHMMIGNLDKNKKMILSGVRGRTIALLITPPDGVHGIVNKLSFGIYAEAEALVKIHLYSIDLKNNQPGKELILSPMILRVKKGQKNIEVSLKHLNLFVPKDGLYVGLEWMGETTPNSKLNIHPFLRHSRSQVPHITYIKFMDKEWTAGFFKMSKAAGSSHKSKLSGKLYDVPDYRIMLNY